MDADRATEILIVDDKPENLLALEAVLEDLPGSPVILKAASGAAALEICLDHNLALVLMDVQMPGMDGYETLSLLRRNSRTRLLPVILISAIHREEVWLKKGIRSGAVDFLPKPIVPEVLLGKVQIFIDLFDARRDRERYIAALRDSEERFRAIFQQAADAISLIDPEQGRIVEFNEPTCRNLGYTREEFSRLRISDFQKGTSPQAEAETIRQIIGQGSAVYETRHRTREGEWRHIHVRSKMVTIGGKPYVQNIWRDITDRKRMEEALRKSNRELEHFAYAASHDLKEPLRGILNFVTLIREKHGRGLPEEVTGFLDRIAAAAARLQEMVGSLLVYSRIERSNEPFQLVDLDEIVSCALLNVKLQVQEKGAVIDREPLPALRGDPLQLTLVFQNLVSNALKFCEEAPPRVEIRAVEQEAGWQLSVQDNGIGIAPAYREQAFELFRRLHSRERYEGAGMGLAIVRRIIRHHGGEIRLESAPGGGTCVVFTLPKRPGMGF